MCALYKGAARVDACRHGLHGLHAMRVDMHVEACVSTVSGFGWPACWSSVAKAWDPCGSCVSTPALALNMQPTTLNGVGVEYESHDHERR